ncbi:MAG: NAD(P)/FAD-dependent oxidoreductase [Firmicutes bacterium]|nr:NAD(P)/FAD-dependent oxidoreductase [Bacillota bacterium]
MKVAIMGAGLSGLSCAITLEKYGIEPVIFEKRKKVGDRFVNGEIFLSTLTKPIDDPIAHLSEKYGVNLQPVGNIGKLNLYSENQKAEVKGELGFSTLRGRKKHSLEKQLQKQVKSKIVFKSKKTYEDLLKEYTHIIMATGDGAYVEKLRNYKTDFTVSLIGAIIKGKFDRYTAMAWLDNKIAPKGYGYLIPLSEKEANIVIGFPDYPENNKLDSENLRDKFFSRVCKDLKQEFKIIDTFKVSRYIIGHCNKPRIGNTFFVGNCFGSIMPFLGFGQFEALITGIYSAEDICGVRNYEKSVKFLNRSYDNSLVLRKTIEKFNNKQLDTLVNSMDGYLGEKVFNSKKLNTVGFISNILKPITKK